MFDSRRKIWRWLKRSLLAGGFVVLLGTAWVLFLPVPLTQAARLVLRITLPPGSNHARVRLDRVVLHYGFNDPTVRIDIFGIAVEGAGGGQLARSIEHVEVLFRKKALWHRNWAPSLIEISRPVLVIDLTRPGGSSAVAATNAIAGSSATSLAVRAATLRAFVPLPDSPCRFSVQEPSVVVKSQGCEARWLFKNIETVFSRQGDRLKFDFPVALANTRRPVGVMCRVEGSLETGRLHFSVNLPRFNSEDLPPLPLIPGETERSRFRVAFDVSGTLRLDQFRLEEIDFVLFGDEGELHLPKFKSETIRVQRLDVRGRARDDFRFIHFDSAVLVLDGLCVDASGLEFETGPSPRLKAHLTAAGLPGYDMGAYLPAALMARLHLPMVGSKGIQVRSAAIDIEAGAQIGNDGMLDVRALTFDGRADLNLDREVVPLSASARIDAPGQPIHAHFTVQGINPAHLRLTGLKSFQVLAALDCQVKLDVDATATARGELRTASLNLAIGHGLLRAVGPITNDLTIRSAALKAEASNGGQTIRVPELRLEIGGTTLSATDLSAQFLPTGLIAAHGSLSAENLMNGLPIASLSFNASVDRALTFGEISARADLGGVVVHAVCLKLSNEAIPIVTGRLALDGTSVDRILRLWPAALHAGLRRQVDESIRTGKLEKADLSFSVPINFEKPAEIRPSEFAGHVEFDNLCFETQRCPGPLTLGKLEIAAAYPGMSATLSNLSCAGVTLGNATVRSKNLFSPAAKIEIGSNFAADLSKAPEWLRALGIVLPPAIPLNIAKLSGSVCGSLEAILPVARSFNPGLLDAKLQARVAEPVVPFTAPKAGLDSGKLVLSLQIHRGQLETVIDWQDLNVTLPAANSSGLAMHVDATMPAADELEVNAVLDARPAALVLSGTSVPAPPTPLTLNAHVTGWNSQSRMSAELQASSSNLWGGPFALAAHATRANASGRLESLSISRLRLGKTDLSAEFDGSPTGSPVLVIKGKLLDVDELLRFAAPFLERSPIEPAEETVAAIEKTKESEPMGSIPGAGIRSADYSMGAPYFPEVKVSAAIDMVDFGAGRTARDLVLTSRFVDDLPRTISLRACEDGTNELTVALMPKGDHLGVNLKIADVSAWLALVMQPLRDAQIPVGLTARSAATLAQIPALLGGGRFELEGDLRPVNRSRWFDGQCKLENIVIRQPPRILKLLALKSGKRLRENPVIREISVGRLFVSDSLVALENIKSDAVSLDHLKLSFIRYGLVNESVHIDGQYAGIGFEVLGTRADPQIFLRNNLLVRAIGSEQEFVFDDVTTGAPPPPPKKD